MTATVDDWNQTFSADGNPWDGEFFVDMAKAMERACFDYIMLEDTLMIADAYGDSTETYLKYALMGPKMDPAPQAALIGAATKNMGVVATFSTMAYPPFMLARLCTTLDHICTRPLRLEHRHQRRESCGAQFRHGRIAAAPAALRHGRRIHAGRQRSSGRAGTPTRSFSTARPAPMRTTPKSGRSISSASTTRCRGPLNTAPSPQGRPAFVQAGGSPRGRQFAAETADSIIAAASGVEAMREYRDDMRKPRRGRGPQSRRHQGPVHRRAGAGGNQGGGAGASSTSTSARPISSSKSLAGISSVTDIDFSKFDLDEELPRLTTNGEQGSLDAFAQWGSGKTLRQLVKDRPRAASTA